MALLAIGMDSFDTAYTGCTTHAASLLLLELLKKGVRILDYPWLVRLNPAAPWKSRGNGAVAVVVQAENKHEEANIMSAVRMVVDTYTLHDQHGKSSVLLVAVEGETLNDYFSQRDSCLEDIYSKAVHEIVDLSYAYKCLKKLDIVYSYGGDRRGVVGSLAALGAEFRNDHTFELLVYRRAEYWLRERTINPNTILDFDLKYKPLTFLNYDYENNRILATPHTYDPILYGVRGEEPGVLLKALEIIDTGTEKPSHWTIFRTNQATNAHLKPKHVEQVRPYDNPIIQGFIMEDPRTIPGGHVVTRLSDGTGTIDLVAYRETKHLKKALLWLARGDSIIVAGQVKHHKNRLTLNLEYISLHYTSHHTIVNPVRYCDKNTFYPPASALHHLSKPPERCLYRQPKRIQELDYKDLDKVAGIID